MTIYIYYCEQESLRRNGIALTVNKESKMQYLGAVLKTTEWSLLFPRQTIHHHGNLSLFSNH